MNLWTLSRDTNMALGNIIVNLFDDIVPGLRKTMGGVDVETGMLERMKQPEMILGPTGVERMISRAEPEQQNILRENEQLAQQMLDRGAPLQEIEARTGFFFDEQGNIMGEIDDSASTITKPLSQLQGNKTFKLDEVYEHPEFFAIYPEMRDHKIKFYEGKDPDNRGYYDIQNKVIGVNANRGPFKNKNLKGEKDVIRTMLHEATHAIQVFEGLQAGSAPSFFQQGGGLGMNLGPNEAYKKYLATIGEAMARNVELRFGKTKAKNFIETLFLDDRSIEAGVTKRDAITTNVKPYRAVYDQAMPQEFEDLNANELGIDPTLRGM
jgi:hypothetical protein